MIDKFIDSHFIYTYKNGWEYELYMKNEMSIYRVIYRLTEKIEL